MANSRFYNANNRFALLRTLFFIVLIILLSLWYIFATRPVTSSSQYHGLQTKIAPAMPASTERVPQDNAVHANDIIEVPFSFSVGGKIDKIFFAEHTSVKQGDTLATLDKAPFEKALAGARARLKSVLAQSDNLRHSSPNPNFAAIETALVKVEKSQHVYDVARDELVNYSHRLKFGQTDNVYLDDVQNEHDAKLDLERAFRELNHEEEIGREEMDDEGYKSAIIIAENHVSAAQYDLENTRLLATSDGVIASIQVEVGDNVAPGDTIYTLSVRK